MRVTIRLNNRTQYQVVKLSNKSVCKSLGLEVRSYEATTGTIFLSHCSCRFVSRSHQTLADFFRPLQPESLAQVSRFTKLFGGTFQRERAPIPPVTSCVIMSTNSLPTGSPLGMQCTQGTGARQKESPPPLASFYNLPQFFHVLLSQETSREPVGRLVSQYISGGRLWIVG